VESIRGHARPQGATFRELPPSAPSQREKVLLPLRDAARSGQNVSGGALRYEHKLRQAPTRFFELIETLQDPDTRLAAYYLRGDPPEGWRPPTKQARFRGKAGAEPHSAAREDALAQFQKTHRADLGREAPLFAERHP
jgi:hypothetical protein